MQAPNLIILQRELFFSTFTLSFTFVHFSNLVRVKDLLVDLKGIFTGAEETVFSRRGGSMFLESEFSQQDKFYPQVQDIESQKKHLEIYK